MNGLRLSLVGCLLALAALVATATAGPMFSPPQSRIVGGADTHVSNYPYLVSVRRRPCTNCTYEHYCGGAIYSAKVVITAANCVRAAVVSQIQVVAGTNYRTGAARDGSVYPVEKITLHEDESINIALIHLSLEMPLDVYTTKAVSLATATPRAGKMATVVGWGQQLEAGAYSEEVKEVRVPIIEHEKCASLYFWNDITDYEICAGYDAGGADACHGDAGSPLIVDGKMAGLVSWGFGCARPNNPGVYTNVAILNDWILKHA